LQGEFLTLLGRVRVGMYAYATVLLAAGEEPSK
jgi:hypothetical protein